MKIVDVILSHRIRLVPTASQELQFTRACGVARFAYNWALAEWQRQYKAGKKPSECALRKHLNGIKDKEFPWIREVTKTAPQEAIKNLGRSYSNFFDDLKKYRAKEIPWKRVRVPKFKKKGSHDSFRADNGTDAAHPNSIRIDGQRMLLPRIGWVRMREEVRFAGNIKRVVISRRADGWFASVGIDVPHETEVHALTRTIGVDLGVVSLATLSDGTKITAPKPLRRYLRKLSRLQRAHARKQSGSSNRVKSKTKIARLHRRIADIRNDALHKLTTTLARNAATVVIEDLNVAGMMTNRRLSRAISDIGFSEFRRQLAYKALLAGSTVIVANQWYASSKLCSACRAKNETLALSERTWTCTSCGTPHDRDENAALNLARYPESWSGSACRAEGSGAGSVLREPAARKQEDLPRQITTV